MNINDAPAYVQRVLSRFDVLRPTPGGWDARCPCPDHNRDGDKNPSLGIAVAEDGKILLNCRVGCQTDAVLEAVGLDWSDLFAPDGSCDDSADAEVAVVLPVRHPPLDKAAPELCQRAYELLLAQLSLSDDHRAALRRRGLPDSEIDRRGYRSLRNIDRGRAATAVHQQIGGELLAVPGFVEGGFGATLHGTSTGLLIPVRDLNGNVQAIKIRREREPKYVYLTGGEGGPSPGSPIHVPLGITVPAPLVRVTEGELKADICTALDGTPTISAPGVTQWRSAIPVLKDLGAKTVILAYDAPDVHTKAPVFDQTEAFWAALKNEGFQIELEDWHECA